MFIENKDKLVLGTRSRSAAVSVQLLFELPELTSTSQLFDLLEKNSNNQAFLHLIYDKQGKSPYEQDESKLPTLSSKPKGKGKESGKGREGPVKKVKIEPSTDNSCTMVSMYTLYYTDLTIEQAVEMLDLSEIVDSGDDDFLSLEELLQRPPAQATRSHTKQGKSHDRDLMSDYQACTQLVVLFLLVILNKSYCFL